MAPGGMATYNNDTSATQSGTTFYDTNVTFYPTCHNEAEAKEDHEKAMEQIERLEDMMYERVDHEVNRFSLQHREVKDARRAQIKHKRPHMNRRIIR